MIQTRPWSLYHRRHDLNSSFHWWSSYHWDYDLNSSLYWWSLYHCDLNMEFLSPRLWFILVIVLMEFLSLRLWFKLVIVLTEFLSSWFKHGVFISAIFLRSGHLKRNGFGGALFALFIFAYRRYYKDNTWKKM